MRDEQARRQVMETSSGAMCVTERGDGASVVLVHGAFLNSHVWDPLIDFVADRYRCIAVDLPTHGGSIARPDQDLSLNAFADAIAEVCDRLETGPAHLVGNDTGGAVAQVLAVRHPSHVRTLTLTNCDAHDNLPPAAFAPGVELARAGQLGEFVRQMADDKDLARSDTGLGGVFENPAALTDETIERFLRPLVETNQRARDFERYCLSLEPAELLAVEDELRSLDAPTLIVWGTGDQFFDISWAYWLADLIPGTTRVVELPGARLFFPFERPAELATALIELWENSTSLPPRHVHNSVTTAEERAEPK